VTWSAPVAEVVLALDLPTAPEALRLLERIPGAPWVKIGSILMTREGAPLVRALVARGHEVFLDLKWHDIPNTVAGAVRAARELGVSMATLHALGGRTMMEAAAEAAGGEVDLVGVTVLTSHDPASYARALGREDASLDEEVARLAAEVVEAGLAGVVCSSAEIAAVRGVLPDHARIVVPGIRSEAESAGDQVRVATAAMAAAAGATHLVVGRPVLQATDPAAVLARLCREAGCAPS
jgi:orotidine-5'-phosphate decarboxylase